MSPFPPTLQVTSDGKPKVLDVIDCTGSGDVDTSTVVALDAATGCIPSASGRPLKVNAGWANPSGKWHVGSKHLYQLLPRGLVARLKDERAKVGDIHIATRGAWLYSASPCGPGLGPC